MTFNSKGLCPLYKLEPQTEFMKFPHASCVILLLEAMEYDTFPHSTVYTVILISVSGSV